MDVWVFEVEVQATTELTGEASDIRLAVAQAIDQTVDEMLDVDRVWPTNYHLKGG